VLLPYVIPVVIMRLYTDQARTPGMALIHTYMHAYNVYTVLRSKTNRSAEWLCTALVI